MSEGILLIEDDLELGRQVVERLRQAGYTVAWWRRGRRIEREELAGVALVILDVMLPEVGGMEILQDLRASSEVPVLVLSARHDSRDKVQALRLGADDYMTKPFWPDELIERVRARLRRPALQRGDVIEHGSLRMDLAVPEVRIGNELISLTPTELAFLTALARRPGQALTREWLVENVLDPEREGSARTLDVHASRLRKKLGDAVAIETVWGIGYRLGRKSEEEP
ncbi:response regulator transcription factor [Pseudenhygromyxa sp. WMMC2535]|uniref:winged helix-turn-helix domain-containing protein n=1 Tax=Pseudenhygromyxa sp. WMMC2535 TaxID=2712867 RepID=UPI001555CB9E|nr:response regulator transcription factor [Pseudenhygromyxa sp. WMMC2535]